MFLNGGKVYLDPDGVLRCAECGGANLHHGAVEIFNRREDAETGVHVRVDGSAVHVDDRLAGNPSGRRHGVTIGFWCELCDCTALLTIAQHKGATFVAWEYTYKDLGDA